MTATTVTEYRYRLKSTGQSSAEYGVCEVCGEYVSDVFLQVEERRAKRAYGRLYWERADDLFGHAECLKKARRAA